MIEPLNFLTPTQVRQIATKWGTPVFVYSEAILRKQATQALKFSAPYGLTVRYAMKANPQKAILKIFKNMGLAIDASSGPEIQRAIQAGYNPKQILLTAQQLPTNLKQLAEQGVLFNASSLHQLKQLGQALPGANIGIRINPGVGSGHSMRTNVGGPTSSFGIWHEYIDQVKTTAKYYNLQIERLHTHIGSGTDPAAWAEAVALSLKLVQAFPQVKILNLGGGFKVGRISGEASTNIAAVGQNVAQALKDFASRTGRKLQLEIEPGSYLVLAAGSLISTVHDITNTGPQGFTFLKIDAGLSDIIRPSMYGAQHAIVVVGSNKSTQEYVVVGRACESGDILTPAPQQRDQLQPRLLNKASIGDHVVVEGIGAYVYTFNVAGYNSFGQATQILLTNSGNLILIYQQQNLDDLTRNELPTRSTHILNKVL
jgi:diaminopimelate decarboxylase